MYWIVECRTEEPEAAALAPNEWRPVGFGRGFYDLLAAKDPESPGALYSAGHFFASGQTKVCPYDHMKTTYVPLEDAFRFARRVDAERFERVLGDLVEREDEFGTSQIRGPYDCYSCEQWSSRVRCIEEDADGQCMTEEQVEAALRANLARRPPAEGLRIANRLVAAQDERLRENV